MAGFFFLLIIFGFICYAIRIELREFRKYGNKNPDIKARAEWKEGLRKLTRDYGGKTLTATVVIFLFAQIFLSREVELFGYDAIFIILGFMIGGQVLALLIYLLQGIPIYKIDIERGKYTAEQVHQVERAFENVKDNLRREKLTRKDWMNVSFIFAVWPYNPMEWLETDLEKAGVFNPNLPQYMRGRNVEEALKLSIWQARHEKDAAILRATEASYTHATAQAATAPDLQKRKEFEMQREGAAQELRRIAGNRVKENYKLPAFNGQCQVQYLNNEVEQLVLMVEAGDYSVKLFDVKKDVGDAKKAEIQNDGDPHTLSGWASGFTKEDTELIVRKRGSTLEEVKPLW